MCFDAASSSSVLTAIKDSCPKLSVLKLRKKSGKFLVHSNIDEQFFISSFLLVPSRSRIDLWSGFLPSFPPSSLPFPRLQHLSLWVQSTTEEVKVLCQLLPYVDICVVDEKSMFEFRDAVISPRSFPPIAIFILRLPVDQQTSGCLSFASCLPLLILPMDCTWIFVSFSLHQARSNPSQKEIICSIPLIMLILFSGIFPRLHFWFRYLL